MGPGPCGEGTGAICPWLMARSGAVPWGLGDKATQGQAEPSPRAQPRRVSVRGQSWCRHRALPRARVGMNGDGWGQGHRRTRTGAPGGGTRGCHVSTGPFKRSNTDIQGLTSAQGQGWRWQTYTCVMYPVSFTLQ